jgi:hypothetical protein
MDETYDVIVLGTGTSPPWFVLFCFCLFFFFFFFFLFFFPPSFLFVCRGSLLRCWLAASAVRSSGSVFF